MKNWKETLYLEQICCLDVKQVECPCPLMSRDQVCEGELRGERGHLLSCSPALHYSAFSVELGSAPGCQKPVPCSEVGILEVLQGQKLLCPLNSLFWFVDRASWLTVRKLAKTQLWVSCSLLCSQLGNAAICLLSLQAT